MDSRCKEEYSDKLRMKALVLEFLSVSTFSLVVSFDTNKTYVEDDKEKKVESLYKNLKIINDVGAINFFYWYDSNSSCCMG